MIIALEMVQSAKLPLGFYACVWEIQLQHFGMLSIQEDTQCTLSLFVMMMLNSRERQTHS